jgi:hypothetical protein
MQDNSKEIEYAYLAGILDGEGAIFITRDLFRSKNPVFRAEIRVGMIEPNAVKRMHNAFGGSFFLEKPYHHKRPLHRWSISNREQITFCLSKLLPYLDVKKEQAKVVLDFIDKFPRRNGHWATQEEVNAKEQYWFRIRGLNGVAMPATTERTGKRGRSKSVRLEATV